MTSWPVDQPSDMYTELSREAFAAGALNGVAETDAAVIGGGIGGLSAAETYL